MKIISIPFSGGGLEHGSGANEAPDAIKKQLEECYADEDGVEPMFEHITVMVDEEHVANSHEAIEKVIASSTEKSILLGGDHSITYSTVKGFAQHTSDFLFVVFDAHPDLMQDFVPPTQESFLRALIDEGIVKPEHCILIGVRNWDKQEVDYLKEKNILCYTTQDIFAKGIKTIMREIVAALNKPVYLSLDIDVVDPVEAIGTGYLEHGGLSSRELLYALQTLKHTKKLAMADIVEVNPTKDINNITSKLAAKCVVELANF